MALSERDRRELHEIVEEHLGGRAADLVLAMSEPELPAVLRGEMAELRGETRSSGSELRGEMAELRGEMRSLSSELRAEMDTLGSELRSEMAELRGEMSTLRSELRGEMAELRGEMAELRGEMAQLGARVDGHVPKIMAGNIAAMIGVAGLVLAAGVVL